MHKLVLVIRNMALAATALMVVAVLTALQLTGYNAEIWEEVGEQLEDLQHVETIEIKAVTTRTPTCLVSFSANRRAAPWRAAYASGRKYMDIWLLTTSRIRPSVAQRTYRCLLSLPLL